MSTLKDFNSIKPTFVANIPLTTISPKFSFITINNPNELKTPKKLSIIRKQAKKDVDRAKRARQKAKCESLSVKNQQIDPSAISHPRLVPSNRNSRQAFGSPQGQLVGDTEEPTKVTPQNGSSLPLNQIPTSNSLDFLRPLGAGRGFIPFANYPIPPNTKTVYLLDCLWQSVDSTSRPMMGIWITISMSDLASFNITLAVARLTVTQNCRGEAGVEFTKHYTTAVHTISKRLGNPVEGISDGTIGSVLGLACFDDAVGNWDRWQVHMSGLQRIIELRGGIHSITSHALQVSAFWADVTGALVLDIVPRFPIPHYAKIAREASITLRIYDFFQKWNIEHPDLLDIGECLTLLANLAGYVNKHEIKDTWLQRWSELFIPLTVHPVAHMFLSMSRYSPTTEANMNSSGLMMREILRLTSLVFLGLLKEKTCTCRTGVPENSLRLTRSIIEVAVVDWSSFMDVRLWVLSVLGIAEKEKDRSWCVGEIWLTMDLLGISRWDEAFKILKELIWMGDLLDESADRFGREVTDFRLGLA